MILLLLLLCFQAIYTCITCVTIKIIEFEKCTILTILLIIVLRYYNCNVELKDYISLLTTCFVLICVHISCVASFLCVELWVLRV